ncbi:MAG: S66 peptidase family protein [Bacilli bacterium]
MSKIIYPKLLKENDIIGITATSSGVSEEHDLLRLENAYKNLNKLSYRVIETNNVRTQKKLVSSSGFKRAEEFMSLWENKDISLIAQVRGGEFLMEMIPFIDENVIKNNSPKWISGYSDSSLLNYYLTTNYNIASLTTTNILNFGMNDIHLSVMNSIECIKNKKFVEESYNLYQFSHSAKEENPYIGYNLTHKVEYKHLYNKNKDKISGRILGGCIDVITILLGTKYDNTASFIEQFDEGILWCIENCELSVAELYRRLWQMKESGWFKNAKGFIIGRSRSTEDYGDFTYEDTLHKIFDDMDVPVIYDIDFGHLAPRMSIINGAFATFEYENHKGKLTQEMK